MYHALVWYCGIRCERALLVVREPDWLDQSGADLLEQLRPYCQSVTTSGQWPGTILTDGVATLYSCGLTPEVIRAFARSAHGLYEWEQPARPEDLCFIRDDDSPMLITIAHERDAYLCLTEAEKHELGNAIPNLQLSIHQDL